ncbi:Ribonuclease BN [Paenibacillus solanacearum]|uniref:Ribonuclease BN n=1 Tax=Paenibacillus solanacearum TaxID=2048548 RepID=A0A916K5E8_9BACL|nr:ribonuclease Z [Paenibacillus solanacearum]CAG7645952.1 Ribonuclease BN [Paenibacillus solanacearum]
MNIIFMGTASAAGSTERDNTYLLLRHHEDCWLIDTGGNPLGKLKQAGIPLDRIKGVMLTHFHVDHMYGLPSLLWGMWIGGRTAPFTIYCSSTGEAQLRAILEGYQVAQWPIKFDLRIHAFDWTEPSPLFSEQGLSVSTFPSLHGVPTVGFKVEADDRVLIYSADTSPNERICSEPKIDLLIHEATKARGKMKTHTSLEDVVRFYPMERIGQLYAVHLTDNEPYGEVLAECSEAVRSKVTLASDMMSITL